MSDGPQGARRDRAVIMARGLSARMGVPKGLLRLSGTGPVFVRKIADLYLSAGFPVDVVTRPETAEVYRRELPTAGDLRILTAPAGGDTALTLLVAWRSCRAATEACSHIWAQPVDLPLVTAGTLGRLMDQSKRYSDCIIRPVCNGEPGHPVVLPTDVLAALDREERWHGGPLRDFLHTATEVRPAARIVGLEVDDTGTIRDFDRPADLDPERS